VSTIHTNLVGSLAKLKPDFEEHGGKSGEIVAVYLDNATVPRFLLSLSPSPSHRSKHKLVEATWLDIETVQHAPRTLCE